MSLITNSIFKTFLTKIKTKFDDMQADIDGKAPKNHISLTDEYGKGSNANYGHVRLDSSVNSSNGTADGYAATPSSVKAVNDTVKTLTTTVKSKADASDLNNYIPIDNWETEDKSSSIFFEGYSNMSELVDDVYNLVQIDEISGGNASSF